MAATLLAVGTDQMLLMTRGEVLKQAGYSVTTADDFTSLPEGTQPGDFDLVILCHTLPEQHRNAMAASVRHRSPDTPIIAVSALPAQRFDYADLTVENDPGCLVEGVRQVLARRK